MLTQLRSRLRHWGVQTNLEHQNYISTERSISETALPLKFNTTLRHEAIGGKGAIAPRILNSDNRWTLVVRFSPWLLCYTEDSSSNPLDGNLGGPQKHLMPL
jgi:hypothetical protein